MSERRDGGAVGIFMAAVAAVVAVFAVVAGVWLLTVALSGPVGQGEAVRQKNTANNRIFAQRQFEQLYAEIEATKVKTAAAAGDESEGADVRRQGLAQHCADVVAAYNAAARTYTTEQFRSADLPERLEAAVECTGGNP